LNHEDYGFENNISGPYDKRIIFFYFVGGGGKFFKIHYEKQKEHFDKGKTYLFQYGIKTIFHITKIKKHAHSNDIVFNSETTESQLTNYQFALNKQF